VEPESTDSGLEELLRLSKEMAKVDRERTKAAQDRAEQRQKVRELQQGLTGLKVSVALEQLKLIAAPEVIKEVTSLKHKQSTESLRKLILNLLSELENRVDNKYGSNLDMDSIKRSIKTLAILIELLFSIE
jgi:uncharacterized protein YeeX (DUF496 family)